MGSKTNRKIWLIVVLAFLINTWSKANGDFTFDAPINLGPIVNSPSIDFTPSISADRLELFFSSTRRGGYGGFGDLWVATRAAADEPWGAPVNLGPTLNSSYSEFMSSISVDGLSLFFDSNRAGGSGWWDLWVTTRETKSDPWGEPVNLGSTVNSSDVDVGASISADGLSLFFQSNRPGGSGGDDLWVSIRATKDDPWGTPSNLGPIVNSSSWELGPCVSTDGLSLFFQSNRPGGYGGWDIWVTTRTSTNEPWGEPMNLGPTVNSSAAEGEPSISDDGQILYFHDHQGLRPGGFGEVDLWQVSIEPVIDLNDDGIVDGADICIIVDHWGTDEPLCDIGPMPWGDGIVDIQDLIVLSEHLFEEVPPVE